MAYTVFYTQDSGNGDSVELAIDTTTNEAFTTIWGYSALSGMPRSEIADRFFLAHSTGLLGGDPGYSFQSVLLVPSSTIFKWLMGDNPAIAEKMGLYGANAYLLALVEYQVPIMKSSTRIEEVLERVLSILHKQKLEIEELQAAAKIQNA